MADSDSTENMPRTQNPLLVAAVHTCLFLSDPNKAVAALDFLSVCWT